MSVNIKINGQTINDIHAVQFENADAPGTNIQFYDANSVQEEKTVTPTTSVQEVVPSSGNLLSKVTVEGVTSDIDPNIVPGNIRDGVSILGVDGSLANDIAKLIDNSITSLTAGDFEGVNQIRQYAFYNCSSLTSVTIGNSVTTIGRESFNSCSSLTSVTIGNSVNTIGEYAFRGCTALTSVTIPDSVTDIRGGAFYYCSSLAHITIPDSVTSIGAEAFLNCTALTSVTIPNSVTSIGFDAFRNCSSLTSVTIGNGITSIGGVAFFHCDGVASIIITATIPPSLGSSVFDSTNNCPIYVPTESVDTYKSASGWSSYESRIQAIPEGVTA